MPKSTGHAPAKHAAELTSRHPAEEVVSGMIALAGAMPVSPSLSCDVKNQKSGLKGGAEGEF